MKYLFFFPRREEEPDFVSPEGGILLRQTPAQYSNKTPVSLFRSDFSYWVKGKTRFPLRPSNPMTRYSVNVTPCRTNQIFSSTPASDATLRTAAFIYLFATSRFHQQTGHRASTRVETQDKTARRSRERGRYFFLIRERRQQPFTQIRFWPKKLRIKLINYNYSLSYLSISLACSLGFWPNSTTLSWFPYLPRADLTHASHTRSSLMSQTIYELSKELFQNHSFVSLTVLCTFRYSWKLYSGIHQKSVCVRKNIYNLT